MADPGRGGGNGVGATANAGERQFFDLAPGDGQGPLEPAPFPFPANQPGKSRESLKAEPHTPGKPARLSRNLPGRKLQGFSLSSLYRQTLSAVSMELDRGAAFLLVPVFLATGVVFYFSLEAEPSLFQPAALVCLLGGFAFFARARPVTNICLLAVSLCVFGFLVAKAETWRASTTMLGSEVTTRMTARVVSIESMETGRVRLTLDVLKTARPTLRYVPKRVRLSTRSIPAGTVAGSTVSGMVRLLPPTGPVRPGSYDFSFQSYFDGIGASGFFLSNPKLIEGAPMPVSSRLSSAIENAREAIAGHIRKSVGGAEGEIAAALIVGVRAGIPESINEAMRKTGIYHIISISGLHMALVAGTVMAMMRGLFALFPDFSSRRPVKKYAAFAALLSIAAYLLISGVVVAAERSFIMLAVMLVAVLFDRAALTMRNLAISAIAVILVSPHEVVGPSFQMSFAATAALVGAYAGWTDYRAGRARTQPQRRSLPMFLSRKLVGGLGGLAITSIVAGSATTLFAMWHFQRVAPLSLFANLAVMPIVSIIVMPFAVLSALAMPFGLDGPFLYVMGRGISAMIVISDWIAARSPIDAVGLVSVQSVLFVTVALVIATMATTRLRWVAFPFALAGLVTISDVRSPDVLISEDGRLMALPIGGGELAVNRARPNEFTIDNWRRALDAETVVRPEHVTDRNVRFDLADSINLPAGTPFLCTDNLCVARHASGALLAHAQNAETARQACTFATLIVIDDATATDPCDNDMVTVVTKRQLARSGSAEVFFDLQSATGSPEIHFAVEKEYRPWHMQRRFSREARGLWPYGENKREKAKHSDASAARIKRSQ